MPLQFLDVPRQTQTDIDRGEYPDMQNIKDVWMSGAPSLDPARSLPTEWTGRTMIDLMRPKPPKGYEYVQGRLTKLNKCKKGLTRPGNIRPEDWNDPRLKAADKDN